MGHGNRGSTRLPAKSYVTRATTLALPFVGFCILSLFINRDCDRITAPASQPTSLDASHDYERHLHDVTHDSERDSSFSRTAEQPANANKPLPSCVTDNTVAESFLMIFMGHSGSTAIISEIRNHSKVLINVAEPIDHNEYEKNSSLGLAFTREFFMRGRREGKIAGFKMRPWHLRQNPEAWIALTKEFNTRIIWQYRQNILKQAVGEYSYRFYKDESVVEGLRTPDELKNRCSTGAGCRFRITDFSFFHRLLKDSLHSDMAIARGVHLILNGSTCVHEMPYEEYLYDREGAMRKLQQFLGVKYEKTAPERFKATSDSLCEVVENWDEVCEKFYGCHVWRHMFDDRHNGCTCDFSSGPVQYCDTLFDNGSANEPPRKVDR